MQNNCNVVGCTCCSGLCTADVKLFSSLDYEDQAALASTSIHTDFKKGSTIIHEGDVAESIRIIRSGKVKLHSYDMDGKEYILDILSKGDSLGENLFLDRSIFQYNITCLSNVGICEISRESFVKLLSERPEASINLIVSLSRKLSETNEMVQILSENNATKRLAAFLLHRKSRLMDEEIELTIDDIAGSINLRRETISRKISELQSLGLIRRSGKSKIIIPNKNNLLDYLDEID